MCQLSCAWLCISDGGGGVVVLGGGVGDNGDFDSAVAIESGVSANLQKHIWQSPFCVLAYLYFFLLCISNSPPFRPIHHMICLNNLRYA